VRFEVEGRPKEQQEPLEDQIMTNIGSNNQNAEPEAEQLEFQMQDEEAAPTGDSAINRSDDAD